MVLFLAVDSPVGAEVEPSSLTLVFLKDGKAVRRDLWQPTLLAAIDRVLDSSRFYESPERDRRKIPHAYRMVVSAPEQLAFDELRFELAGLIDGAPRTLRLSIPAARYQQKTKLIFPLRGPAYISVGGALASGHRNRSGLYAIDILGMNKQFGPLVTGNHEDDPADYAGWGRQVIAPASGIIVFARNDHADQPVAEKSDPAFFLPQYKDGGDPGNYVIIDHQNGEFSMIAHMRKGSVRVSAGAHVGRGQLLGLLGNSGDTSGPHVHYQLQNGADWEKADALPFAFVDVESINRGDFVEAKPN